MISGVHISTYVRPLMMAFVLLVLFTGNGHAASGCGAVSSFSAPPDSVTLTLDETGSILSQGMQRPSQDATLSSGLLYGLQKAGAPLKSVVFIVPTDEVTPHDAPRIYRRGCFIKYFYRSIQPQAP